MDERQLAHLLAEAAQRTGWATFREVSVSQSGSPATVSIIVTEPGNPPTYREYLATIREA